MLRLRIHQAEIGCKVQHSVGWGLCFTSDALGDSGIVPSLSCIRIAGSGRQETRACVTDLFEQPTSEHSGT